MGDNTEELYSMKLHETIEPCYGLVVLRVPGGWIYRDYNEQIGGHFQAAMCFIPYDNEYQK